MCVCASLFRENYNKRICSSSARTRRVGSCLRVVLTFLICRTCMRRAPARPVRACFVRTCCTAAVQEHDLRATPVQCNAKRTLSSHITLHSSQPALHTSHLHFALHTSSHLKSCELFSPHFTSSQLFSSLSISSHTAIRKKVYQ